MGELKIKIKFRTEKRELIYSFSQDCILRYSYLSPFGVKINWETI